MTNLTCGCVGKCRVEFVSGAEELEALGFGYLKEVYEPEYLAAFYLPKEDGTGVLLVGTRGEDPREPNTAKELAAAACKALKERKIHDFTIPVKAFVKDGNREILAVLAESVYTVTGPAKTYKTDAKETAWNVGFDGAGEEDEVFLKEGRILADSVLFARDMVNAPANYLRPEDFAAAVVDFVKGTDVEAEIIHADRLKEMGMGGLLGVGMGSQFPPCLTVLRYQGDPDSQEKTGIVGKGVTMDTGGYCLKPAAAMAGMQGDMAGAAAVAGALCALARMKAKVNVTAVMPMCENRISGGSFVAGDVLTSYSGKTIEVANTDAEGRLILADAVTYAVRDEKVTRVLDIATLTGAVVRMLGFTIAGVITDSDEVWKEFSRASEKSGEKYWRLPFGKEHEKMIESKVADIRNTGASVCGTITAGLFIRSFAEGTPWIHVDIAGTAWVEEPAYAYQEKYATGNSVDTIYHWLKK